ncbi:MAG TPA: PA2779 family protein [Terracidiphilus sp.]|nr:PA2779 family protein [Terracidiphilus sp.]
MHSDAKKFLSAIAAATLTAVVAVPQAALAQPADHLVSPSDLTSAAVNASHARQQNLETLNGFLSSAQARQAIESAHMNPHQVTNAVAGLSDAEVAQLAARASNAQKDFAAGTIDNHDLLLIIVAIAALILIIVAVH